MSKGHSKIGCYECGKVGVGKNKIECCECGEVCCKEHAKYNEQDYSTTCLQCFKKKIHLEVTLEMENETLEAETELNSLKAKLKMSKKDLANKKSSKERHENQIKINEKTYLRKFENLGTKIEEERERGENIDSTVKSMELTLDDSRTGENNCKVQLDQKNSEYQEVFIELEALKKETKTLKHDIQIASAKSKDFIPYSHLRTTLCASCKNKVKLCFREEILTGNQDKASLVQSVLAEKIKHQQRQSELANTTEKVKPCCSIS